MNCLVTGAAGFIGSHLCEELLRRGHKVTGVDAFIPSYPQIIKQRNLLSFLHHPNVRFYRADLRSDRIEELLTDAEVIFHLAAVPELMQRWSDLEGHSTCNVLATQRLLDATRRCATKLERFVFASASSVYGQMTSGDETLPTLPLSPSGITKLAAEYLCRAYAEAYRIPIVTLRYFAVYGPRQRPDMGYHRLIQAILENKSVRVYDQGHRMDSAIYVADCVRATIAAAQASAGEIYNVGGGELVSIWDILDKLESLAGRKIKVRGKRARPCDLSSPCADTSKLRQHLGWTPQTSFKEGLTRQWEWQANQPASKSLFDDICASGAQREQGKMVRENCLPILVTDHSPYAGAKESLRIDTTKTVRVFATRDGMAFEGDEPALSPMVHACPKARPIWC